MTLTILGFLGLAAANIAMGWALEPPGLRPIQVKDGVTFEDLLRGGGTTVQRRALVYTSLARYVEDAEVVTFPGSRLDHNAVVAITGAGLVVDRAYDPHLAEADGRRLLGRVHHSGEFSRDEPDDPFAVVVPIEPGRADRFRAFLVGRILVIVDEYTLDALDIRWGADA